jgi:hypothetical protein
VLLGAVGLVVLLVRRPALAALCALPLAFGALGVARGPRADAVALPLLLAGAAAPIGAGIAFLATRVRFLRLPIAVVLGVTVLVEPALHGGLARWRPSTELPGRLLEAAHGRSVPGAAVVPGSSELEALLYLGAVIGLRPDLALTAGSADRSAAQGKMPRAP